MSFDMGQIEALKELVGVQDEEDEGHYYGSALNP